MSLCIGLTGGIASGKSTVAAEFAALGADVIDADTVAREVVAPGSEGLAAVAEHFGPDFLSPEGALDRRRMREHVFADPARRRELEGLLHPRIRAGLHAWREALQAPYGLMMVPILVEGGFDSLCQRVLVVDVAESVQIARLQARDDIDATLARQMLAAQASRAERLARADDVIDNSGPPEALAAQVAALHRRYLDLAGGGQAANGSGDGGRDGG